MLVMNPANGFWKLHWSEKDQRLYRLANSKYQRLDQRITDAYLDYKIELLLLGE